MKIDILCSNPDHPVVPSLRAWARRHAMDHDVAVLFAGSDLRGGDILFLVSCSQMISADTRALYRESMVLHASDLPKGRGWSPYVWELIGGAEVITVSLLRAEDPVDSGAIWDKQSIEIPRNALFDEINVRLFDVETALMDRALSLVSSGAVPKPQPETGITHWPRRQPEDSRIDPRKSLVDSFDQIRVADPDRYPAFFELRGARYCIELRKVSDRGGNED